MFPRGVLNEKLWNASLWKWNDPLSSLSQRLPESNPICWLEANAQTWNTYSQNVPFTRAIVFGLIPIGRLEAVCRQKLNQESFNSTHPWQDGLNSQRPPSPNCPAPEFPFRSPLSPISLLLLACLCPLQTPSTPFPFPDPSHQWNLLGFISF